MNLKSWWDRFKTWASDTMFLLTCAPVTPVAGTEQPCVDANSMIRAVETLNFWEHAYRRDWKLNKGSVSSERMISGLEYYRQYTLFEASAIAEKYTRGRRTAFDWTREQLGLKPILR